LKSLIFNSFAVAAENDSTDVYDKLLAAPYSDERGYGFENIELEENILSATLIKRNATYIHEYDPITREMLKKQIMLFSDIKFQVDFNYDLLCVFGQAVYLTQLKSAMRNVFDFSFSINQTDLSPYKIYLAISEKQIGFEIKSIAIERFVFQNGISGKLIGTVIDNIVASDLINSYKTDVNKVLFQIDFDENDSFGLQASNNGALKFFGSDDMFDYHLNFFKRNLFK
jgi:hypothetical protein